MSALYPLVFSSTWDKKVYCKSRAENDRSLVFKSVATLTNVHCFGNVLPDSDKKASFKIEELTKLAPFTENTAAVVFAHPITFRFAKVARKVTQ